MAPSGTRCAECTRSNKTLTLTSGGSQVTSMLTEACRCSSTELPRENSLQGLSVVSSFKKCGSNWNFLHVSTCELSMNLKQPERMYMKVQGAQNSHRKQDSFRDSHGVRARISCIFIFTCCKDQKCQAVAAPFLPFGQLAVIFLLVKRQTQHSTVIGLTLRSKAYPKLAPQFYNPLTVNLTQTQAGFRKCRS